MVAAVPSRGRVSRGARPEHSSVRPADPPRASGEGDPLFARWTRVPVVSEREFRERVTLLRVALDPRKRTILRVYSLEPAPVSCGGCGTPYTNLFTKKSRDGEPAFASIAIPALCRCVTTIELSARGASALGDGRVHGCRNRRARGGHSMSGAAMFRTLVSLLFEVSLAAQTQTIVLDPPGPPPPRRSSQTSTSLAIR